MKLKHSNKPGQYTYRELMMCFQDGIPLSADQLNFLSRHEKTLSSHGLDPVLKYYLKPYKKKSEQKAAEKKKHSFLLHADKLSRNDINEFKRKLDALVEPEGSHVILTMTPEQFEAIKHHNIPELILYHGNQFLSGAPHHIGGIPYTLFFQWGNLFGVAKYVILAEEKCLKSNLLAYVEDMQDRDLMRCIDDYNKHKQTLENEFKSHELRAHEEAHLHTNEYTNTIYKIPKLTLAIKTTDKENEEA